MFFLHIKARSSFDTSSNTKRNLVYIVCADKKGKRPRGEMNREREYWKEQGNYGEEHEWGKQEAKEEGWRGERKEEGWRGERREEDEIKEEEEKNWEEIMSD